MGNWHDFKRGSPPVDKLIKFLKTKNISYGYTGFWNAYQLTFVSKEKIIFSPSSGPDVYPKYTEKVRAASPEQIAVIFERGDNKKERFENRLKENLVSYQKQALGNKIVYYSLSKKVDPSSFPLP